MPLNTQQALRDVVSAMTDHPDIDKDALFKDAEIGETDAVVSYTPEGQPSIDIKISIVETTERQPEEPFEEFVATTEEPTA